MKCQNNNLDLCTNSRLFPKTYSYSSPFQNRSHKIWGTVPKKSQPKAEGPASKPICLQSLKKCLWIFFNNLNLPKLKSKHKVILCEMFISKSENPTKQSRTFYHFQLANLHLVIHPMSNISVFFACFSIIYFLPLSHCKGSHPQGFGHQLAWEFTRRIPQRARPMGKVAVFLNEKTVRWRKIEGFFDRLTLKILAIEMKCLKTKNDVWPTFFRHKVRKTWISYTCIDLSFLHMNCWLQNFTADNSHQSLGFKCEGSRIPPPSEGIQIACMDHMGWKHRKTMFCTSHDARP